jgi:peptidyl-prolyl cis-trans isomerase D
MATLQNLRNKAGILLAAVIFIALAAFILGDLLQSGSSLMRGNQMRIAQIDGESVDYVEFQARFDEIANVYKSNNQTNSLDEKAYQQILTQTWETTLQEKIMGKIYDDLGIDVTPEEMFDMVQGNNLHPIIQQIFGDPQTGRVNKSNIIQFLKYIQENPTSPQKNSWLNVEKQILSSKKLSKYTDLVGKGLVANSIQAKQSLAEKEVTAALKFIQKKYSSVSDSAISVSNSEMKAYYDNHISEYEQKNQKILSYVTFDIVPSSDDEQEAQKFVSDLKSDFIKAENNAQFVNANADTRFEDTYVSDTEINPNLAAWAFSAVVNDVFGPIKEVDTYKLFKLNAIKMLPDSVQASHILIRVENGSNPQDAIAKIDSIKKVIESGRQSFELAARMNSSDGSASMGGDLGWFKKGMMVAPFEKAAFNAEKEELVVAQTQFGVHLIKVTAQGPKSKKVQLAVIDRKVTPSTTTYQNIYSTASQFAAKAQNLEGFNKVAAEQNISKRSATVGENDRSIPTLGAVRNLVRSAFIDGKVGKLVVGQDRSPIFETEERFIVAAIESEYEEGTKSFESVKSTIKMAVAKEKKQQIIADEFNKARGASIEQTGSSLGLEVGSASGFRLAFGSVNAIGYEPAVNGAVAKLDVSQQSKPIIGRNGVYIVQLTEKTGSTTGNIEAEKNILYQNATYRANYQAFETLKKQAEIVDNRWKFY